MITVLVVSPKPSVPGGVTVFIETMKRYVARCKIESFYVGSQGATGDGRAQTFWRLVSAPAKLCFVVWRKSPNLVHINPSFDAKSLVRDGILILALRLFGFRRIFVYFHGWDYSVQRIVTKNLFLRMCLAFVLNLSARITVLGEGFRIGLIGLGVDGSRVRVTRTMFEGAPIAAAGSRNIPQARRSILFMSRFDPEKGAWELLQAFISLAEDFPDLDLVLAGDGIEFQRLRQTADKSSVTARITLKKYIVGESKWQLLTGCTIFALPTYYRSEGMPIAILEAMGAGKPVLVGNAGSISSIVRDRENGVVLNEISPETVETGLRTLLADQAALNRMADVNKSTAWQRFEATQVTRELEEQFEEVSKC